MKYYGVKKRNALLKWKVENNQKDLNLNKTIWMKKMKIYGMIVMMKMIMMKKKKMKIKKMKKWIKIRNVL